VETARLTLHEVGEDDAAFLVTMRTDPAVRRYLGGPMSVDEATAQTELTVRYAQGLFVVTRHADRERIGLVMLHPGHGGTEISYQFAPSSWSQGFASEAVRCVVEYAFEFDGITELLAVTQTANARSRRLLERLGATESDHFEEFGEPQTLYRVWR
jgi:RimJ/RimL family protein N-acetyltransferase